MANLQPIDLTNDKGNVKVGMRNALAGKVNAKLMEVFADKEAKETNKGIVFSIGTDTGTGKEVFVAVKTTITFDAVAPVRKAKAKEKVEIEVPNIFGD
jgi:hypothetical protein